MTEQAVGTFLEHASDPVVVKGFVQIGIAAALAAVVIGIASLLNLGFEREIVTSSARGLVQILAAGSVIGILLAARLAWAGVVLAFMVGAAAWISHKRGDAIPGTFLTSAAAIGVGAGAVVAAMTAAGVIERSMRDLVVIGSMVIAMAMKTNSLTLDRFTGEVADNRDEIEAALAVGAPPPRAISEYVSTSVYAALIPVIDRIKSLGIVSIPGLMSGMIIAGANPVYAAQYQFAIMLMLFAAGGLTSAASMLLVRRRVFTEAKQLDDGVLDAIDG